MPAVQQVREHRTNAKTRGDGLYSMGFSWFDCEPQAHDQLRYDDGIYRQVPRTSALLVARSRFVAETRGFLMK